MYICIIFGCFTFLTSETPAGFRNPGYSLDPESGSQRGAIVPPGSDRGRAMPSPRKKMVRILTYFWPQRNGDNGENGGLMGFNGI